jgi:hypothetical protein
MSAGSLLQKKGFRPVFEQIYFSMQKFYCCFFALKINDLNIA